MLSWNTQLSVSCCLLVLASLGPDQHAATAAWLHQTADLDPLPRAVLSANTHPSWASLGSVHSTTVANTGAHVPHMHTCGTLLGPGGVRVWAQPLRLLWGLPFPPGGGVLPGAARGTLPQQVQALRTPAQQQHLDWTPQHFLQQDRPVR